MLEVIERYAAGANLLRECVDSFPTDHWDATPVADRWSARQVVCHLADAEVVYADRMKRVLAEDNPTLFDADPDVFVPALHCEQRDPFQEVQLVAQLREHMLQILRSCDVEDFQRTGVHSTEGPMTLETLLERITGHIPHHIEFIRQKQQALRAGQDDAIV